VLVLASIMDGTGAIIERHLLALRVTGPGAWRPGPTAAAAIQAMVTRHLEGRVRRVERRLTAESEIRLEAERALAAHLQHEQAPELIQPGLFSAAERRSATEDRRRAEHIGRDSDAVTRAVRASLVLSVGHTDLEVIWCRR
jgi:hypothetical protein